MAERWWRAYDGSIDHPKLLKLSDAMHRAWFTLQCIASANNGVLPPAADIAVRLRVKQGKVAEWLAHLVTAGLVDREDGIYKPHNWNERQYKVDKADPTAAQRAKKYRDGKRDRHAVTERDDRDAAVTVERPETETETETKQTQKKDAAPDGAHSSVSPIDSLESQFFRRAHEVLGSRGLGAHLLKAKGDLSLARSALELAATKAEPKEYVGAIIRGKSLDLRERGDAW